MLFFVWPPQINVLPTWAQTKLEMFEFLRLGFPQAFAFLGEIGAFSLTTLLVGTTGIYQVAAHQIEKCQGQHQLTSATVGWP